MTTSVDDRIRLLEFPRESPGSCAVCTKATHEDGFVDIGMYIEWHGYIYFCADCAVTIGRAVKMITADEYATDRQLLTEAQARLTDLVSSVERLESTVDALSLERLTSRGVSVEPVTVVEPEPEPQDADDELDELLRAADSLIDESADSGEADDDATDEPVTVEGPDDVSEPASDNIIGSIGL